MKIYRAGERVAPGTYKQINSSRVIYLEREDRLPTGLSGRDICFERIEKSWEELLQQYSGYPTPSVSI